MALTVIQERAAELMVKGYTHQRISEELGVVRLTVTKWNKNKEFRELVDMLRKRSYKTTGEALIDNIPMALETVIKIAETGGNRETVNAQLRAAMYILENAKKLNDAITKVQGNRHTQRSEEPLSEDEYDELLKR